MKWILIVAGGLAALAALVWIVGALVPRDHVASRKARYHQSPEAIWAVITDAESMPAWRKNVQSVRLLPEQDGHAGWVEKSSFGEMPMRVVESVPPRRLVMRIDSDDLPFGGTWTFEIEGADGEASLRITENGFIKSPFFRFMSRVVFGYTATMEQYLKDLGKKFGETVEPLA